MATVTAKTSFLAGSSQSASYDHSQLIWEIQGKVLAPVEFQIDGKPVIRRSTGGDSKNSNGNSLLLRLDYGRARILLTGDLNKKSQRAFLEDYDGMRQEFQCDVAKSCHHGSDDISYEFLAAMNPAATVISFGDNEGHDHPRPNVVGASAVTGHLQIRNDELITPLVYSTEIAEVLLSANHLKLWCRPTTNSLS